MHELKIGDTVIAGLPDHVAKQLVDAAKAAFHGVRTAGSRSMLEKLPGGLCRLTVPLEVVIEYWPPDPYQKEPHLSPRLQRLETRVERANKLSLLGPFVPGDGKGSTIKTHHMVISLDVRGTYQAFMFSESDPLHGNPRGTRSVSGWGRTKEEAAKDAFALLWYGE